DDYAHLPTEVVATISAAKSGNWNRLVAVFQPHRYSRTEALWRSFGEAFNEADLLYVTDVYPSGEAPRPGVSGQLIVDAVRADCPDLEIHYVERRTDLVAALGNVLADGDCCLTMGAGDLTTVPDEVQMLLSGKNE
ncbi:MAG: cyanophycin synthetase, partial [Acidimicrobiales bacterium]